MMRRVGWMFVIAVLGLVLQGCSSSSTSNGSPTITSFTATSISGGAAYHWAVSDSDGDTLSCALDANNDGTADVNVADCGTNTSQSYAFASPGSYISKLTVNDGHGNVASATVAAIGAGTSTTPASWTAELGTSVDDLVNGATVDANGNAIVVGYTGGTISGLLSYGGEDAFVAKYDATGHKTWAVQFGTSGNDYGVGVATDSQGNIIINGYTDGAFVGFSNQGGIDIFVAKYDANGQRLWVTQFGSTNSDYAEGVTTDANGNIYVDGYTEGAMPGHASAGSADVFLAKYDANGNQVWVRQFGTSSWDNPVGIASDANGNTVLVGGTGGSFPTFTNAGGYDVLLAKYDTNGNQLWLKQFGTSASDSASGTTVDSQGNITIVGSTQGALPAQSNAGGSDVFVAKYDSGGNQLWLDQFGTTSNDYGVGITMDSAGDTTIVGGTLGAFPGHANAGNQDVVLAEYDPDGNQVWLREMGTSGVDIAVGIGTGANGSTIVGGYTNGAFPGDSNAGGQDAFLIDELP